MSKAQESQVIQEVKELVEKDLSKRRQIAKECARRCAAHPNNRTNPFAYVRAYMLIMSGILTRTDFAETNYCPGDVS